MTDQIIIAGMFILVYGGFITLGLFFAVSAVRSARKHNAIYRAQCAARRA